MKRQTTTILISLGLGFTIPACSSGSDFKASTKTAAAVKAADANSDPAPQHASLTVSLSANEVRSGGQTIQATAKVADAKSDAVTWAVAGPPGIDVGTIDAKGLYLSPAKLVAAIDITITATLVEDTSVTGSQTAKVIPADQIFVGCQVGSEIFPIVADVYVLPKGTAKLPDFSTIASSKKTTVCMDKYDVATRKFTDGFPGIPDLFEWFALNSKGKIIIPADGDYQFRSVSDDGSNFYIDGSLVVANDGQHSTTAKDGKITLKAGNHDFVLDYFQGPADQIALQLFWKKPGDADFTIVPTASFAK